MDFTLTEEQRSFKALAQQFAETELKPYANTWDVDEIFPVDALRKAAALGFAGIGISTDVGGAGLSRLDAALVFEELATACPSTAAYLSVHNMASGIIDHYGDAQQRQRWLPSLTPLNHFASYCLTEPSSGSDAASLKTTAERKGDYYILNGSKAFISGGSATDIYVCMVRTGGESSKGISCLIVEKNTPGLSFGKKEAKLGWHSQPTTMVFFENCKVPVADRIRAEGEGFKIALSALNSGRINIAACSLGGAKFCLQAAKNYANTRAQFGKKIAEFEAIQFKLADMFTELEAARLLVHRGASALDSHHEEAALFCALAKRYATDVGFNICNEALQIHGGMDTCVNIRLNVIFAICVCIKF